MNLTTTKRKLNISPMQRGNIIHKLMELKLDKHFGKLRTQENRKQSIMEFREIEKYVLQDETLEEHAEEAVEQVISIYEEHAKNYQNISITTEGYLHWGDGKKGRADVYLIMDSLVHVIDLKTGENFNVIEPTDTEFRGYAAGTLRLVNDSMNIEEIRISVINGRKEKVATFKADDIRYWDDQQVELSEFNRSIDSQGGITEEINNMTQKALNIIENHPEEISPEFIDAVNEFSKLNSKTKNQAIEEIKNGREIEGHYIESKTTQNWKVDKLADRLEEKGLINKDIVVKAYKPQKPAIEAMFNEEDFKWAEEEGIFERIETNGYNLKKY